MSALKEDLRKALRFYKELGFEHFPVDQKALMSAVTVTNTGSVVTLDSVREEIGDCHRCRLSEKRTHIVFGEGSPEADLMFIGEGPGREEDIQARPFVGEAGRLLTSLIEKLGMERSDVYIANVVKCRPPMNRDPAEDEIAECILFLKKQIAVIRPKVIMTLGRISTHALTGVAVPISRMRGHFYSYDDIPVMPTYHPAYLLRNRKAKWDTWDDAQKAMRIIKGG